VDVDWNGMFHNHYEVARVKIQCKEPHLLPDSHLFEIKKKHYSISFIVEFHEAVANTEGPDDPDN